MARVVRWPPVAPRRRRRSARSLGCPVSPCSSPCGTRKGGSSRRSRPSFPISRPSGSPWPGKGAASISSIDASTATTTSGLLLEEVRRRRTFQLCYIASHGQRRKLVGFGQKVIHLENLIEHCRPSPSIGYIFGACDFVTPDTARKFLLATGARFVAGYQKAIPWTESMLVDCLFLSYLLGRHDEVGADEARRAHPAAPRARGFRDHAAPRIPRRSTGRLYRDFPLAHDITFSCFNLDRARGRRPRLVNSFDQYRKSVDRARRLVRDI